LVSTGGWRIPSNVSKIKSLVVGGGGAGGSRAGGGGGAGGYVFDGSLNVNKNETYSVVVGTGGFGSANSAGANGTNSSLGSLRVAIGGGGGGHAGGLNNSTRNGRDQVAAPAVIVVRQMRLPQSEQLLKTQHIPTVSDFRAVLE
jgi:hypothetical protein